MDCKVGFIGFGLIAGSIAHALKESGNNYNIAATSRRLEPVYEAKKDGVVDDVLDCVDNRLADCDYIILCTPVITMNDYLKQLKNIVKKDCIITDVGSVKTSIHNAVKELDMEDMFIGGHPMAGSELTGYANSSAAIMKNARYVITPTAKTTDAQLERFKALICDMKANPIVMDYATHDKTVAAISHLPHLISTALVKLVSKHDDSEKHMQMLAAGSFRDMTRVAASSPEMWDQICASNSEDISALLGDYIDILSEIKHNIDNKTPGYVNELFEMSREYKNSFRK